MSILQDQKGLVWFSTWNGLNKFDGYTFKTYKTSQESKYAFGSNRMGTISESKYKQMMSRVFIRWRKGSPGFSVKTDMLSE